MRSLNYIFLALIIVSVALLSACQNEPVQSTESTATNSAQSQTNATAETKTQTELTSTTDTTTESTDTMTTSASTASESTEPTSTTSTEPSAESSQTTTTSAQPSTTASQTTQKTGITTIQTTSQHLTTIITTSAEQADDNWYDRLPGSIASIINPQASYSDNFKALDAQGVTYTSHISYVDAPSTQIIDVQSINAVPCFYIEQTLTEEKVFWVQEYLKIVGYYASINGQFNARTKEQLANYTKDRLGTALSVYTSVIENQLIKDTSNKLSGNIDNLGVLVNKQKNLSADAVPSGLVEVSVLHTANAKWIKDVVNQQLSAMFQSAAAEGITLRVVSAYRSFDYQIQLFDRYAARNGIVAANTYSALPGQSEHQTGLVVDVDDGTSNFTLIQSFDQTAAFKWLDQHAHQYGFILRYPKGKEAITGYIYEPWHYRYIGNVEAATYIHENGITYEEYLSQWSVRFLYCSLGAFANFLNKVWFVKFSVILL